MLKLISKFFLSEEDLGKNRAACSIKSLVVLNTYVPVHLHTETLNLEFLKTFQVVVLTDSSQDEQLEIGEYCHSNQIKFIASETKGTFGLDLINLFTFCLFFCILLIQF
jgi:ubiquitin-activating enzyme E1